MNVRMWPAVCTTLTRIKHLLKMNDEWLCEWQFGRTSFFSCNWTSQPEQLKKQNKQQQQKKNRCSDGGLFHLLPYKSLVFAAPGTPIVFHVLPALSPVVHWTTVTRCTFLKPEDTNRNPTTFSWWKADADTDPKERGVRIAVQKKKDAGKLPTRTLFPPECHKQQLLKQLLQSWKSHVWFTLTGGK